jgi:hypothetical protein
MMAVNIFELERLVTSFEDDDPVLGIDDAYVLFKHALTFTPSVHDIERLMRCRELLGIDRLKKTYEHEFPVLFTPDIITHH